jgi:hypothetical protein
MPPMVASYDTYMNKRYSMWDFLVNLIPIICFYVIIGLLVKKYF